MNPRMEAWRLLCRALAPGARAGRPPVPSRRANAGDPIWPWLVRFADHHLVTAAAWSGLAAKGLASELPEEPRRYLRSVHAMNARRNRALAAQLDEGLATLNARGIVPLLLKGAAYLRTGLYPDRAARIQSDLDLWIEPAETPAALEALAAAGYRDAPRGRDWSGHRHRAPLHRPGDYATIEIHSRLASPPAGDVLDAAGVLARRIEPGGGGRRFTCLEPTDMALMAFLHSHVVDRYGDTFTIGLRPLQDLVALDAAFGDRIDWSRIRRLAGAHGLEGTLRDYLLAARRSVGLVVGLDPGYGPRDWAHYGVSLARVRWRWADWLLWRADDLSAYKMGREGGAPSGPFALHRGRLRLVSRGVRRRARTALASVRGG